MSTDQPHPTEQAFTYEGSMDPTNPYMTTYSGVRFYYLNPTPSMIRLIDIAHSLAHTCRYRGHAPSFYSVAEHCIIVSDHLRSRGKSVHTRLWGLLHDAAEAYIGDIISPFKQLLHVSKTVRVWDSPPPKNLAYALGFYQPSNISQYEEALLRYVVGPAAGLPVSPGQAVHESDQIIGERERKEWGRMGTLGLSPTEAKARFIRTFHNLHQELVDSSASHPLFFDNPDFLKGAERDL